MSITARGRRRAAGTAAAVLALGGLAGCGFAAHAETSAAAAVAPNCLKVKCVALTFDDGPGASTGRVLDILAEKKVHATFFVLGRQVRQHPDLVNRAVEEGHEIGDHTWDHKPLTSLPAPRILKQINRTADEIENAAGIRPDVMRPPAGAINGPVAKLIGLPAILWSVDTRDWQHRNTEKVVDAVREQAGAGAVVLMHDIYPSTVDAVPRVIDQLRADGYALVTIRELFDTRLKPGKIYHGGEKAYANALVAADKAEKAHEVEEYLENDGQPEIGAVPGPITPRTISLPAARPEDDATS